MNTDHRLAGLSPSLWIVLAIIGVAGPSLAESVHVVMPKDRDLIALVREHRPIFERLRRMVTEDMHKRSYFSEAELGGIEPESRKEEYRSLLRLKKGLRVTVTYNGSVRFIFATAGLSAIGPGWLKGIQFVPTGTKLNGTMVKTLDGPQTLPVGVYLVGIEPEWFLLYQADE